MPARATRTLVAASVALCVVIGVVAGAGRSVYVADFSSRLEPARQPIFDALGLRDPPGTDRETILHAVDDRSRRTLAGRVFCAGGLRALALDGLGSFHQHHRVVDS